MNERAVSCSSCAVWENKLLLKKSRQVLARQMYFFIEVKIIPIRFEKYSAGVFQNRNWQPD